MTAAVPHVGLRRYQSLSIAPVRHGLTGSALAVNTYTAPTWNFSRIGIDFKIRPNPLISLARPTRFERVTYGLEGRCSIQLS